MTVSQALTVLLNRCTDVHVHRHDGIVTVTAERAGVHRYAIGATLDVALERLLIGTVDW